MLLDQETKCLPAQIHLILARVSVCFRQTSRWRYKPKLSRASPALSSANKGCDFSVSRSHIKGSEKKQQKLILIVYLI